MGGRQIQDNLVVAHEVFHSLKRRDKRGRNNVVVKLDMSKVYDRLEWSFIEKTLVAYGFDRRWVDMIMKLVRSVTYKYKVNGFISQKLIPHRGLRQGNPLSPYLFILAADTLSHMFRKALEDNRIEGVQLAVGAPILTHLFFANDALLFAKALESNIYQFVEILNAYSKASGQRINLQKSGVIGGKFMNPRVKLRMAELLQMQLWDNPGKYLGLPADWGRSRVSALNWIKERIMSKIEGWKENLLNQAGKEILIKSILQVVPAYAMAILRFPGGFCKNICVFIARFWWKARGRNRGIHWKKWEELMRSKIVGGLGFKDFEDMNSTLLARQAWRVIKTPQALWVRILHSIYYPNTVFTKAKLHRNVSWVWSSLLHGRDIVLKSTRWSVGNGEKINIYEDNWIASGSRVENQGDQSITAVKDLIDQTNRSWDYYKIRSIFNSITAIKIVQTPISW